MITFNTRNPEIYSSQIKPLPLIYLKSNNIDATIQNIDYESIPKY